MVEISAKRSNVFLKFLDVIGVRLMQLFPVCILFERRRFVGKHNNQTDLCVGV